jgi:hypothetical protein
MEGLDPHVSNGHIAADNASQRRREETREDRRTRDDEEGSDEKEDRSEEDEGPTPDASRSRRGAGGRWCSRETHRPIHVILLGERAAARFVYSRPVPTALVILASATPGGPRVDPERAAGETMLLLAVALLLLLLLATVVGRSMLRRAREDAMRRHPPTVVRDAWREAGRRTRVEPQERSGAAGDE